MEKEIQNKILEKGGTDFKISEDFGPIQVTGYSEGDFEFYLVMLKACRSKFGELSDPPEDLEDLSKRTEASRIESKLEDLKEDFLVIEDEDAPLGFKASDICVQKVLEEN